jgi:biopolymer transport protein ExbD
MVNKTGGKVRQKKMNCRVDFTPMVDMNMLLITFFMLCTSLSKPSTMDISMPSNDKNITDQQRSKVKASQAITILLADKDRVFYYTGLPTDAKNTIKESTYSPDGIRKMLLEHNVDANIAVANLKKQRDLLKVNKDQYQKQLDEIKGGKDTPTVIIKALDTASYKNLIDALDEMQICNIGKYVIDKMDPDSKALIKTEETKLGTPAK